MYWLDWLIIILYFVLLVIIGYQTSKRIQSVKDYNVAGERIIWPVMFATLAASFIGGGATMGATGNVFQHGLVFMFAIFSFDIATILTGYFVAPRLKRYKGAQSIGDVMERHYGKAAKLITGFLSIGLCAGILGAQAVAIGSIFRVTIGIPPLIGIIIGMGLVILYSTFGGLWAVIQTDVLQFVILGVVIPLALFIGLFKVGGTGVMFESIPSTHFTFFGDWTFGAFISLFIAFLLGETLVPPYAQRAFSSKDAKHSQKGYVVSGFFSIGFNFVVAGLGFITFILYPTVVPDQALPTIVSDMLPIGVTGLAIAALLAVIMSTASSYLNSTTVSFMQDVYVPFINDKASEKKTLLIGKIVTFITGVLAVIFALKIPNIIDALTTAYTLWAPTIIFPLVIAVMTKVKNPAAGLSGIISGGIVTFIWTLMLNDPFGLTGIVPGLLANILAFTIAFMLTKNKYYPVTFN